MVYATSFNKSNSYSGIGTAGKPIKVQFGGKSAYGLDEDVYGKTDEQLKPKKKGHFLRNLFLAGAIYLLVKKFLPGVTIKGVLQKVFQGGDLGETVKEGLKNFKL